MSICVLSSRRPCRHCQEGDALPQKCWCGQCEYVGETWGKLLTHARTFHKLGHTHPVIVGTDLLRMGKVDLAKAARWVPKTFWRLAMQRQLMARWTIRAVSRRCPARPDTPAREPPENI